MQTVSIELLKYKNRHGLPNRLLRLLWRAVWLLLFRPTPAGGFHWWRKWLLRLFGAKIGRGCAVYPSCRVWCPWNMILADNVCLSFDVDFYCVNKITVGSNATISQYSFICTASHDIGDPAMDLVTAPINIGEGAWIAARSFISPGVTIGSGAVVGACSVVTKDVASMEIVAGNPAHPIGIRKLRT